MKTELLPKTRTKGAELIVNRMDVICSRLPSGVDPQHFIAASIMEADKLPSDTTRESIATSCLNAATAGLIPGKPFNHCHFVAFKNKHNGNLPESQLMIGYEGFLELAFRNSFLKSIYCEVVCDGENFVHRVGIKGPYIKHDLPLARNPSRNNIQAAYCVWEIINGGTGVAVVSRAELDRIDKKKDVWQSDYPAMAKKTAIRRASKLWKKTPQLMHAVAIDEQMERGETQSALDDIGINESSRRLSLNQLSIEPESGGKDEPSDREKTPATVAVPFAERQPGEEDEIPY